MTNRQSNIIFYGVIAAIVYGLIINHFYPEFFDDLSKSKEELAIKEAVTQGEHTKALGIYQRLVDQRVSDNDEVTIETANMHEAMATLQANLANKVEEKNHYLKSLAIKEQIDKVNPYSLASTYFSLGSIAEKERQYDQAQQYYEQSLSTRLGTFKKDLKEGFFDGMQNTQEQYKRLNNAGTIVILKTLGALHSTQKEDTIAKQYYERALAVSKLTLGDEDAKTLEIMALIQQLSNN